tara:strand:+ start:1894 stop:2136 length:243 start_codon:yes stop_codon:yes gene_type:complete
MTKLEELEDFQKTVIKQRQEIFKLEARIQHLENTQVRVINNVTFIQQAIEKLTTVVDKFHELWYCKEDTDTKEDEDEQTH